MEKHITPERIANSIGLDKSYSGFYLLVEGIKDIKLYKKFINTENCQIKPTFGKYKLRKVHQILSERGFSQKLGIRDSDFLRLKGNVKFDAQYNESIFPTDSHDSECMIIGTGAFEDFLGEVIEEKEITSFVKKHGDIRGFLYARCYPLACLRLANKRSRLGLSFKPQRPEGNKIRYKKIICDKSLNYLGNEKLVNTLLEYSTNNGGKTAERSFILAKLQEVIDEKHPENEIINGHDLAEVLLLICKKGLRSKTKTLQDSDCVEAMLRLAYNYKYFSQSNLFTLIDTWQNMNQTSILK